MVVVGGISLFLPLFLTWLPARFSLRWGLCFGFFKV